MGVSAEPHGARPPRVRKKTVPENPELIFEKSVPGACAVSLPDSDCPHVDATEAFGAETTTVRNGASVPITELIQRILGIEPVLMGFGLPSDNLHAPNEHFRLEQFYGGIRASAAVLANLGQMGRK